MKPILTILLLIICAEGVTQKNGSFLVRELKMTPAGPAKFKLYKAIASYYQVRQLDSAVYYISEGMKLAEQLHNPREQALFMLQLGTINERHGNMDIARKLVMDALTRLRAMKDKQGIALAYAELGLLEGKKLHDKESNQDFAQALRFFNSSKDTSAIVQILSDLGEIYEARGDTTRALSYYLRALQQYGENYPANNITYLNLLDHIGQLYILSGNAREALRYLQKGIGKIDNPALADTETELIDQEGKAYEQLGQKKRALELYKLELEKAKQNQLPFEQAKALVSIAGVLKSENTARSLADLKKALQIADKLQDKQLAASIFKAMAEVYQQQNNYQEALLTLDEHHRLLDSLFGADKARELAGLDSSYELIDSREQVENLQLANSKKNIEIKISLVLILVILVFLVLLYIYFRKVKKLNLALKDSNQVKDKLFSVLGHDLRGPIGSAVQLIDLLEDGGMANAEQKELLGLLKKQSEAVLEVLESVLRWGQVQIQGIRINPVRFHPKTLIDKSLGLLKGQADAKQVTITDNTNHEAMVFADPDHFEFIIRNLVSNAIKFSHRGGQIDINTKEQQDSVVVFSVSDQGVGISQEKLSRFLQSNMETSFGTGGEKGTGLGLQLTKEFLKAGGGEIRAESTEGKGTTFYFTVQKG